MSTVLDTLTISTVWPMFLASSSSARLSNHTPEAIRLACRLRQTGNVHIAEVIACLIFILMEDLNSLSNLSESRRCPAGRDSQEMPPDQERTPGSFSILSRYDRSRVSSPAP